MNEDSLTERQRAMVALWEEHMRAEFDAHDIEATMATMAPSPFVNHVPVMTGGVGRDAVRHFYSNYFLPGHPPDTRATSVARTVGEERLVDEMIHEFTHTIEMPWILPGIAPTGRRVALAVVVVVEFDNGRVSGERIYWDQASLLAQLGLIDADSLPVCGAAAARKVADPGSEPSNRLIPGEPGG